MEVASFTDHREFLKSYFETKKQTRAGFSFRRFSQLCGFSSPNYLQLVMQGRRNLTRESAEKIANALKLSAPEKKYFLLLVEAAETQSPEAFEQIAQQQLRLARDQKVKTISQAYRQIVRDWHHLVIREMVTLENFEDSVARMSQQLYGLVTPEQVEQSLELMLKSGFLKKEGARYLQTEPALDTGEGFGEADVLRAHMQTLQAWSKILFRTESQSRECGLLNIPMRKEQIPELVQRIRRFQDEVISWLQNTERPDTVVQLGTYLIPISKP